MRGRGPCSLASWPSATCPRSTRGQLLRHRRGYEGFGLPALKAIACGTPVVAYDAGAIPTTAGPGALLVPPGDGAALMRAAGSICDDAEVARRLAEEGRRHAAAFTWRRTAELTWDVYAACLTPD